VSALSNNETLSSEEAFDPCYYVRSLCENTKIIIPSHIDYEFEAGWKEIIQDFVNVIKDCSIAIINITDSYSQLDISFAAMEEPKELIVWRAVENARRKSHSTCPYCGKAKTNRHKEGTMSFLCKACTEGSTKNGKTGTWLDKF
jgi:ribosomal protein L37AE/L43A